MMIIGMITGMMVLKKMIMGMVILIMGMVMIIMGMILWIITGMVMVMAPPSLAVSMMMAWAAQRHKAAVVFASKQVAGCSRYSNSLVLVEIFYQITAWSLHPNRLPLSNCGRATLDTIGISVLVY